MSFDDNLTVEDDGGGRQEVFPASLGMAKSDPIDENERLADADAAEGRVVPHARVREWLNTLGTPDQLPTPFSWRFSSLSSRT
uniref:Uncharacterized protein n=1 Tax=Caulobacter sp. (strain K31) TaxID=366602 RepID=B0SW26_CAUSK